MLTRRSGLALMTCYPVFVVVAVIVRWTPHTTHGDERFSVGWSV